MKNNFLLHIAIIIVSSLPIFIKGMDTNNENKLSLYLISPHGSFSGCTQYRNASAIKNYCSTLKDDIDPECNFVYPVIISQNPPKEKKYCEISCINPEALNFVKNLPGAKDNNFVFFIPETILTKGQPSDQHSYRLFLQKQNETALWTVSKEEISLCFTNDEFAIPLQFILPYMEKRWKSEIKEDSPLFKLRDREILEKANRIDFKETISQQDSYIKIMALITSASVITCLLSLFFLKKRI